MDDKWYEIENDTKKGMPREIHPTHFKEHVVHSFPKHKVERANELGCHQKRNEITCYPCGKIDDGTNGVGGIGERARCITVGHSHAHQHYQYQGEESHFDG